jgi:hypothetical protein
MWSYPVVFLGLGDSDSEWRALSNTQHPTWITDNPGFVAYPARATAPSYLGWLDLVLEPVQYSNGVMAGNRRFSQA